MHTRVVPGRNVGGVRQGRNQLFVIVANARAQSWKPSRQISDSTTNLAKRVCLVEVCIRTDKKDQVSKQSKVQYENKILI